MNARTSLLLSTPLLLFLGSSRAPVDEITFGPEAGSSVTKTFETKTSLDLDDFTAVVDGQNVGDMIGSFEISVESTNTIQVTDTYDAVEGSEVAKLTRSFEELTGDAVVSIESPMMEPQEQTTSTSSDLAGLEVVFERGEDGVEVSFADGSDGDEELLDGLEMDMDLRFLLPEGSVDEGDTWSVNLAAFKQLVMPGGDLSFNAEGAEDMEGMEDMIEEIQGQFSDEFENLLDGTCEAVYKGMREEDGVSLAEIAFEIELSSAADLTELIDQVIQMAQDETGEEIPLVFDQADLNVDGSAEGTLLWNVAAGRAQSLDLTSSGSFAIDLALSVDAADESHSGEISLEFSIGTEHSVEFE
ncbi:MAG TPA: hypothetical protein ENJ09_07030 [Planctomycetes bacterium]|nr:hypothetical protein [Planctomycetota bacterium]